MDYDAENWLGTTTLEEMLKHHAMLVETENELLRSELDRYRRNQVKLIDMLTATTAERDTLRAENQQQAWDISSLNYEVSNLSNALRGRLFMQERAENAKRPYPFTRDDSGSTT